MSIEIRKQNDIKMEKVIGETHKQDDIHDLSRHHNQEAAIALEERKAQVQNQIASLERSIRKTLEGVDIFKVEKLYNEANDGKCDAPVTTLRSQIEEVIKVCKCAMDMNGCENKAIQNESELPPENKNANAIQNPSIDEPKKRRVSFSNTVSIPKDDLGSLREQIVSLREDIEERDEEFIDLNHDSISQKDARDLKISQLNKQIDLLQLEIDNRDDEFVTLNAESIAQRDATNSHIAKLQEQIEFLRHEIDERHGKFITLNEEATRQKYSKEYLKKQLVSLQQVIDDRDDEFVTLNDEAICQKDFQDSKISQLREQISSFHQELEDRNEKKFIYSNEVAICLKDAKNDVLRKQIELLRREIDERDDEFVNLNDERICQKEAKEALRKQLTSLQQEIDDRDEEFLSLNQEAIAQNRAKDLKINKLYEQVATLQQELEDRDEEFASLNEESLCHQDNKALLIKEIALLREDMDDRDEEFITLNEEAICQKDIKDLEIASMKRKIVALERNIEDREEEFIDLNEEIISLRNRNSSPEPECIMPHDKHVSGVEDKLSLFERSIETKIDVFIETGHRLIRREAGKCEKLEAETYDLKKKISILESVVGTRDDEMNELNEQFISQNETLMSYERLIEGLSSKVESIRVFNQPFECQVLSPEKSVASFEGIRRVDAMITPIVNNLQKYTSPQIEQKITKDVSESGGSTDFQDKIAAVETFIHDLNSQNSMMAKTSKALENIAIYLKKEVSALTMSERSASDELKKRNAEVNELKNEIKRFSRERHCSKLRASQVNFHNDTKKLDKLEGRMIVCENRNIDNDCASPLLPADEAANTYNEEVYRLKENVRHLTQSNNAWQQNYVEIERVKTDLIRKSQFFNTSWKSASAFSEKLLEKNRELLSELVEIKTDNSRLRQKLQDVRGFEKRQQVENSPVKWKYERILRDKDVIIKDLEKELATTLKKCTDRTKKSKNSSMQLDRESYLLSEIARLKEQLKKKYDTSSNEDYNKKIMEVLKATHTSREVKMRKMKKEMRKLRDISNLPTLSKDSRQNLSPRKKVQGEMSKKVVRDVETFKPIPAGMRKNEAKHFNFSGYDMCSEGITSFPRRV